MNCLRHVVALSASLLIPLPLCAAPPVVSNVRASQRPGTKLVDVYYDLSDADGDFQEVRVQVSGDGGLTYTIPANHLTGSYGPEVPLGANRHIVWDAGADWDGIFIDAARIRVSAFDGTTPPAPPSMAYIPGGLFQMGDNFQEGDLDELPVHSASITAFFIDQTEITARQYLEVYQWAVGNGFTFSSPPPASSENVVRGVSWTDAAIWCNARSLKEGLEMVYRRWSSGSLYDIKSPPSAFYTYPNFSGYRLPTEAEWEKAARGGLFGRRFYNDDNLTQADANYGGSAPVEPKSYESNGYGIFDMLGNVSEWCGDIYRSDFYGYSSGDTDPRWPAGSSHLLAIEPAQDQIVTRGGSFSSSKFGLRVANRSSQLGNQGDLTIGFRCVRRP